MQTAYGVGSAAQFALEETETKREEKYSGGAGERKVLSLLCWSETQ